MTRECDWCGTPLAPTANPDARTCSGTCRITLSRWRRGQAPFDAGGKGHDRHGRYSPHNPAVARQHHDRDMKRQARARGPIRSDARIQQSRAVEACVAAIRQVARVNVADARVIAEREVAARMPRRFRRV